MNRKDGTKHHFLKACGWIVTVTGIAVFVGTSPVSTGKPDPAVHLEFAGKLKMLAAKEGGYPNPQELRDKWEKYYPHDDLPKLQEGTANIFEYKGYVIKYPQGRLPMKAPRTSVLSEPQNLFSYVRDHLWLLGGATASLGTFILLLTYIVLPHFHSGQYGGGHCRW